MNVRIREMVPGDWKAVRSIYLEGIETGEATFELDAPSWEDWASGHLPFARLVAVNGENEKPVGWAALSPISRRAAYKGVAEVSVYVGATARAQGVGRMLLDVLINYSESHGIWTLQSSVFPENLATVALHEACGFRKVGTRERIGKLQGKWRDTILFERRSRVAGID